MARSMKISESVLAVLSAASFDGPRMTLSGALDRKLYIETAKVIEAAGGKWNRAAKAHVFECGSAADQVEPIILTGEIMRPQDMGQFDSPPAVVDRVLELAAIERGMTVLEPSAGLGNIARALRTAGCPTMCVEIDEKRAVALGADGFPSVIVADFLGVTGLANFDRVVMNPPFAPAQADIDHVLHALNFLKPEGRLVSVMSAGVMFRSNAKTIQFLALVDEMGGTIERLPEGSFRASGTDVNTCIVVIPGRGKNTPTLAPSLEDLRSSLDRALRDEVCAEMIDDFARRQVEVSKAKRRVDELRVQISRIEESF